MYKKIRREFEKNPDLTTVALDAFNQVNYKLRKFERIKQCIYEGSMVKRCLLLNYSIHM